jgi:hypothetical protein
MSNPFGEDDEVWQRIVLGTAQLLVFALALLILVLVIS